MAPTVQYRRVYRLYLHLADLQKIAKEVKWTFKIRIVNIDFFPKILPLKDDELVMSEM